MDAASERQATSRRGELQQCMIQSLLRNLHQFRGFGPDQSSADDLAWVNLLEDGAVERELADVCGRRVGDSRRRGTIGLVVGDEDLGVSDDDAVDLAGDACGFVFDLN